MIKVIKANKRTRPVSGFTIIELLVSLAITAITFVAISQIAFSSNSTYQHQLLSFRNHSSASTIQELIENALVKPIHYDFLRNYRLQPPGKIKDINEQQAGNIQINSTNIPLTILKPNSQFILIKDAASKSLEHFCLITLNSEKDKAKAEVVKTTHWIAITVDGYYQSSSSTPRLKGSSRCKLSLDIELTLSKEDQEMFGFSHSLNYRPFALIPIDECYSIYLDNKNTLRRISHISKENQPIMRGIKELIFTLNNENTILTTTFQREATQTNNKKITFTTSLPYTNRGHYLDFIF